MQKTKTDIIRKRERKKSELEMCEKAKLWKKSAEIRVKTEKDYDRLYAKADRKSKAYLNKKFAEYDRKCKNEIRKLEGKPERVYKKKKKKLNIVQFAMELMQENAKLRDTDISGNGICISCGKLKTRKELAGGHRYSRKVKNICLCAFNINAQCNGCNRTTGPRGDKIASERTNRVYDENLNEKFGKGCADALKECYDSYFKNDYDGNWQIGYELVKKGEVNSYLIKEYIPQLIEENETRWRGKDFGMPSNKWKKIWKDYVEDAVEEYAS